MTKIVIIGGGFGGLTAVKMLSRSGLPLDIALIDKKSTSDFLPELPDCLGRGISPDHLSYPMDGLSGKKGFKLIIEEVLSVDLGKKTVSTKNNIFTYDFLIIASGSETNFYGNENICKNASKLDDVADARMLAKRLNERKYGTYIIGGGGYTGVEVAANIRLFLEKNKRQGRVVIIERASGILGPLPEWIKGYVISNFERLDVDVVTGSQIEKIELETVYVSGGKVFNNALVIWAAGVRTADFIQNMKVKKNPQGRIETDEYLRLNENSYVIGDAAYVRSGNGFLRMAVQFAITEGECAARNIMNTIKDKKIGKFKPVDLGYIIPMANNRSCGEVLGIRLKGRPATLLHFIMCAYRSWTWRNGIGILKGLKIWR